MKLQTSAVMPPFARSEAILRLVAKSVSRLIIHPWVAVPGITPGIWLIWRLRRRAGLMMPARLGDPVFTLLHRSDVNRCPVRPLSPTMWGGPRDRIEAELHASSASSDARVSY